VLEAVKKYTAEEAEGGRRQVLESKIAPNVKEVFDKYPKLKSAVLLIAHRPIEGVADALSLRMPFSVQSDPDITGWAKSADSSIAQNYLIEGTAGALEADIIFKADGSPGYFQNFDDVWDGKGEAISLFSAFCHTGLSQVEDKNELYAPFAIFRRGEDDEEIEIQVIGEMHRPDFNGVMPLAEQLEKRHPQAETYADSLHYRHAGPKHLEKAVWSKTERAAGGIILRLQNAMDGWFGPKPDEQIKPVSEYDVLKYILAVFVLIFLVMGLMTLAGISFPTE